MANRKTPATDPFASLTAAKRTITPRKLRGEKLKLWEDLVAKHFAGEFDGVGLETVHDWCVEHLGLTCTSASTKLHLRNAVKVLEDA